VLGTLSLIGYVIHARRSPHPVLRLDLLKIPTFRASVLGGFLFRVGIGAIPFLLPLMLQVGFGLSPVASGSLTFIAAVGALFMKTMAKRILARFGFRRVLTINAFIGASFIAINGLFTPSTPHWLIMAILLVGGCFRSLQFTSLNAIAYADISKRDMSYATSLSGAAQQVALSMGVAFGAFVVEAVADLHGRTALTAADFGPAFWAVAFVSSLAGFAFARLDPSAGAEMSGHRTVEQTPAATGLGDGTTNLSEEVERR
jgi:fucose permease